MDGRYRQHPGMPRRRHSDRVEDELRAEVERMRAAGEGEPTGRFSLLPRAPVDPREVRAFVPFWKRAMPVVFVCATLAGGVLAVIRTVVAAQDYVTTSVKREVAPVREDVAEVQRNVRELLRRIPDKGAP